MASALALTATVLFGLSHFLNGVLAKRGSGLRVALYSQLGGAALFAVAAGLVDTSAPTGAELAWAAVSGVGAGVGVCALYEGLRWGGISVVVPLSGLFSVSLPMVGAVVVLGERPGPVTLAALAGLLPAVWLLTSAAPACQGAERVSAPGAVLGGVAGTGFGLQLYALAQIGPDGTATALLVGQAASFLVLLPVALAARVPLGACDGVPPRAAAIGTSAALAMLAYVLATHGALLGAVVVVVALYPAIPVLLGVALLGERLRPRQLAGLALAGLVAPLLSMAAP